MDKQFLSLFLPKKSAESWGEPLLHGFSGSFFMGLKLSIVFCFGFFLIIVHARMTHQNIFLRATLRYICSSESVTNSIDSFSRGMKFKSHQSCELNRVIPLPLKILIKLFFLFPTITSVNLHLVSCETSMCWEL